MQVAIIAPTAQLRFCLNSKVHLVLAHLCLPGTHYSLEYNKFYCRDDIGFKILDNGAAEGALVANHELMRVAMAIQADEVIVPDQMNDCNRTLELARRFRDEIVSAHSFMHAPRFMGVVQGTCMSEWLKCINGLAALGYIDTLAFPRNMNKQYKQQRYSLIESLYSTNYWETLSHKFSAIHCLGASGWTREAAALCELPIRSMDTSLMANYALANCTVATPGVYIRRPDNFFNLRMNPDQEKLFDDNIWTYFGWAGYDPFDAETSGGTV
jgi:hypothetical protein